MYSYMYFISFTMSILIFSLSLYEEENHIIIINVYLLIIAKTITNEENSLFRK